MKVLEYTVRFTTPAFLGDAEQNGRWRTPPFKALLRQWWRVAEVRGRRPDIRTLHKEEGKLFGRAADEGTTASQVRLRLDWRDAAIEKNDWDATQANQFSNLMHPEVKDRRDPRKLQQVGTALYLGFGSVAVGNVLARPSVLAAGVSRVLKVGIPPTEEQRFREVIRFAHAFGTLGSRCRNGWGSLHFDSGGLAADDLSAVLDPGNRAGRDWLRPFARDWKQALDTDWCHAVGTRSDQLLLWRTDPMDRWEEVLRKLAEVKIGFRTQFHFQGGGAHAALCDRQILAYPVTNHPLGSWRKEARSANQIIFKVLPYGASFVGFVAHLSHGLPGPLVEGLSSDDRARLDTRQQQVWAAVHAKLDNDLIRLP